MKSKLITLALILAIVAICAAFLYPLVFGGPVLP